MAATAESALQRAIPKLKGAGFDIDNPHAKTKEFVQLICEAIFEEIHEKAKANVTAAAPGQYPIL